MKLDLRIERLVLQDLQLPRRERELLGEGIQRELARLLSEPIGPAAAPEEGGLASRIAAAVHTALLPQLGGHHRLTGAATPEVQPGRWSV